MRYVILRLQHRRTVYVGFTLAFIFAATALMVRYNYREYITQHLMTAIWHGDTAVVHRMLQNGADPTAHFEGRPMDYFVINSQLASAEQKQQITAMLAGATR